MSNLSKKSPLKNVQPHIESAYVFVKMYLPNQYVEKVQAKLVGQEIIVSDSMVRNVKNRTNDRNDILLALVEVAKENKDSIDKIQAITK
jgi:hypothetical protein